MSDVKYEIIKHIGIISTSKSNWNRELNLVSWNGKDPKYDLRDWSPDHGRMGKGMTLNDNEAVCLTELLKKAAG